MNKKTYFSVGLIVIILGINSEASTYCKRGNFAGQIIGRMNKNIQKITDGIDEVFSDKQLDTKAQPQLTLDQEKESVVIKVMVGEEVNKIDASMKNNRLTIDIPEKNQKVLITYNPKNRFLSVSTQRSEKGESKRKSTKESTHEWYTTHKSVEKGQTLKYPINLENAKIDYEKSTLIITIANIMAKKEITKKIEVNIK